jgi:predicted Zn-ribbon and HTH transcriptional regulator
MELKLADFVLYIVVGCFLLVPVIAVISRTLHAKVDRRALANRVICRLCLHAFEDSSHVKTVHCPACGAKNEKAPGRRLG